MLDEARLATLEQEAAVPPCCAASNALPNYTINGERLCYRCLIARYVAADEEVRAQRAEIARLQAIIRGEILKWEKSWDLKDETCEAGDPAPFECAHCYALSQIEELKAALEAGS